MTLVGGGPVATPVLKSALKRAPRLVAVDGGADACLAHGLLPERVTGDMDSLTDTARDAFGDRLDPVPEQDSTDFEKALRGVTAPFVLATGFLGGRVDHALAVFSHMAARQGPPVVLLSEDDCVALCPARLQLDLAEGDRVSLWPLAPCRLASTGLHWPLDGLTLRPAGRVGTSNRAEGRVTLECDGPCLLIVDAFRLDALLAGLGTCHAPG